MPHLGLIISVVEVALISFILTQLQQELTWDVLYPPNSFSFISEARMVVSIPSKPFQVMLDTGLDTPDMQSSDNFVKPLDVSDLETSSNMTSTGWTEIQIPSRFLIMSYIMDLYHLQAYAS